MREAGRRAPRGAVLDTLARRVEPRATWDDLVLPKGAMDLLAQIADEVRRRRRVQDAWDSSRRRGGGTGVAVLFVGAKGTGKTFAAEVLASRLGMDLYRVDLSAVVSKYIGETEKNLRRVFDAAESGGAILLFDEADALFGKRSEVKDSHDRYANVEVAYLLRRLDAHCGLTIFVARRKRALRPAFVRRLRFVVEFPRSDPT